MMHINEEVARCLLCENAPCGKKVARAIRALRFDNLWTAGELFAQLNEAEIEAAEAACIHYDKPIRIAELKKSLIAERSNSETVCQCNGLSAEGGLKKVIIFAGKKQRVKELTRTLRSLKIDARAMHSDLEQSERDQVMLDFKNGKIGVLVATDVVSRGIDVTDIPLVINYDVPHAPEDYVHRIGRTARAENSGEAMTLVSPDDMRYWKRIERFLQSPIKDGESSTRSGKGCSGGSRHSSRNRGGRPHTSRAQGRGGFRRASKPRSSGN